MGMHSGEEEKRNAHYFWYLSTNYYCQFVISVFFFGLATIFAHRDIVVPVDNYLPSFFEFRNQYTNSTIFISEVLDAMDVDHPFHKIYTKDHVRYNFGSHFLNHCKLFTYPEGWYLPSLLRVMQLSVEAQACLRIAILAAVTNRLFCIFCKFGDVEKMTSSVFVRILWVFCILFEMINSSSAMLLAALQKDVDKTLQFLLYHSIEIFAVSFLISAACYTTMELFDKSKTKATSWFFSRCFTIVSFGICFPTVREMHFINLNKLSCHPYVEAGTALCEYICIGSVIFFYATQWSDFTTLEAVLSCDTRELRSADYSTTKKYYPQFLQECDSLSVHFKKIKIVPEDFVY